MISGLKKSKGITDAVSRLFERFGEANFEIMKLWDADLCAVGIKNSLEGENLIYISTYKIKKRRYFIEVEDSNGEVILNGYENGVLRERSFEELSQIVTKYLHLQTIYEQ